MIEQHTHGPWFATGGNVFAETDKFYPRPVAAVGVPLGKSDIRFGELEANARLIAAAPDLLEALKLAHKALEAIADEMTVGERYTNAGQHLLDSLEPSRAAIAKATGQ